MARLFPQLSACRFDTPGERRLAERLYRKLEDDYLVWCNVPVGAKALHPDFIVLHPQRGLLVLEVKDWRVETVHAMDRQMAQIHAGGGIRKVASPMLQARGHVLEVKMLLERDPALQHPPDSPYAGKLAMPWGWGVVLTRVTRRQFNEAGWNEVLDPDRVICSDEMTESVDPEALQQRLWDMFTHVFPCRLTVPQIDRVRAHLFPELRVNPEPGQFGLFGDGEVLVPDLIKVMDMQQEQLARSLGEGHRVIHGVAGSGKTMILAYRGLHLSRAVHKPVLVLCYNRSLAGRLRQLVEERGGSDKVAVRNFHAWCYEMVATYHLARPPQSLPVDERMKHMVDTTIAGVESGRVPRAQYAGILIDEGHDFEPEWFKLVVQMLDPQTNSLLVLYDDAQSIYRKAGKRRSFSFSSVGIQAQGRTTILRLNYRNTAEVLAVARRFAEDLLAEREAGDDDVPQVQPQTAGRHGAFPELIRCDSPLQEWDVVVARIRAARDDGRALSDIAVIYRSYAQARDAERALRRAGIRYASGASREGRDALFASGDAVKIVSMHSSKGLEFPMVLIPGVGSLPTPGEDPAEEARLLYVAMTRALDHLVMTCSGASDFARRIQASIAGARDELADGSGADGARGSA